MQTFSVSEQTCMHNTGVRLSAPIPYGGKKWMDFLNSLSFMIYIQPVLPVSTLKKKLPCIRLDAELHKIYEIKRCQ